MTVVVEKKAGELMSASSPQSPDGRQTYSSGPYWNSRYAGVPTNFDWFFNYNALKTLLCRFYKEHVSYEKPILHVGCGNSTIQEGLAQEGFTICNMDISEVVIDQMKTQHQHIPNLSYYVGDCRHMPELKTGTFQACVDKGTLDAVLCSSTGQQDVASYLREVSRVLCDGGLFFLISLGQPDSRMSALLARDLDWEVDIFLLPKPDNYLKSEASLTGRTIKSEGHTDKNTSIKFIGPCKYSDLKCLLKSQELDLRDYFFAYVCRRNCAAVQKKERDGAGSCEVNAVG